MRSDGRRRRRVTPGPPGSTPPRIRARAPRPLPGLLPARPMPPVGDPGPPAPWRRCGRVWARRTPPPHPPEYGPRRCRPAPARARPSESGRRRGTGQPRRRSGSGRVRGPGCGRWSGTAGLAPCRRPRRGGEPVAARR